MDKIIYVPLDEETKEVVIDQKREKARRGVGFGNAWDRGNYQKNQVYRALVNCKPDDLIIFSDVDEIPSIEALEQAKSTLQPNEIIAFQQKMYRGYYNRRSNREPNWIGSLAMKFHVLATHAPWNPNGLRTPICFGGVHSFPGLSVRVITGGWHFSSMGDFEQYIAKMDNWEHFENQCPRTPRDRRIEIVGLHRREEVDFSFPKHIQKNLAEMRQLGYVDESDDF